MTLEQFKSMTKILHYHKKKCGSVLITFTVTLPNKNPKKWVEICKKDGSIVNTLYKHTNAHKVQ